LSADEERLAELETAAALLFERRDGLNREAERRRKERDRLNEAVRSLRANATEERDKRDELNRRVAEIKKRMEGLRQELGAKREELARLDGVDERRRLPPRGEAHRVGALHHTDPGDARQGGPALGEGGGDPEGA